MNIKEATRKMKQDSFHGADRPFAPGVPPSGLVADSHLGVLRRVH